MLKEKLSLIQKSIKAFENLVKRVEFVSYEQIIATYEHEWKRLNFNEYSDIFGIFVFKSF